MSKPLSDAQLLERLCEEPLLSKLGMKAAEAFPKWLAEGRTLTPSMRRWLRGVAERLGLQVAPSENIFSQLPEAEQKRQRERAARFAPELPWEREAREAAEARASAGGATPPTAGPRRRS